jgi:shikimate dehydrogenase
MKRACVIGWPISHSLSPVIHRYWLNEHGLHGEYVKTAVEPARFPEFFRALPELGYSGANITIPHKVEAYRLCAVRDAAAEAIGAVNTVWFEGGKPSGSNSDAYGFTASLDEEAPGWDRRGRAAVVVGAGGAARAIIFALVERGFDDIRIVNRTSARGEELSAKFPHCRVFAFDELERALSGAGLTVNASSLGMAGAPSLSPSLADVASGSAVFDAVYRPIETDFLRQARTRGLSAVGGLGMLLHQAVPGFEKWFGLRPSVSAGLRKAVLEAGRVTEEGAG